MTTITTRLKAAVRMFQHGYSYPVVRSPERKATPFLWPEWRMGQPQWHAVDYQSYVEEGFNINALIYSAIMYKVRALSSVVLRGYTGTRDNPEPLDADHPLSKLLDRPNPHQSWLEMQGQDIVYQNIAGNVYHLMLRDNHLDPKRLHAFRCKWCSTAVLKGYNCPNCGGKHVIGQQFFDWAQMRSVIHRCLYCGESVTGDICIHCGGKALDGALRAVESQVSEIHSLRPDRVFVVPGKVEGRSTIKGYLYVPEGKSVWRGMTRSQRMDALERGGVTPILPENMMHTKLPNPSDPLEGMGEGLSPVSSMARNADVDNAVTHYLKLFFEKGVIVPGILSTPDPLTDEIAARIKERWKEVYGGYERWAEEIAVLESGLKYQRVGLTFNEMGFDSLDERNESRILSPFGVPPILIGSRIGLKASTYSNYMQARQAFWDDTAIPEMQLFEADFKYYLRTGDEFVQYDYSSVPAMRDLRAQAWEMANGAVAGGWATVNEARAEAGLPSVEGGDIFLRGLAVMPVPADLAGVVLPAAEETEEGAASSEEEEREKGYILELPTKKAHAR